MKPLIAILALVPAVALATGKPEVPSNPVNHIQPVANGGFADSDSLSSSTSVSSSNSTSGAFSASGDSVSSNSMTITSARQAPSVGQGAIVPPQCGAGAGAGGSNVGGAAFLGMSWVTRECHGWLYIASLQSLGLNKSACEALKVQNATKRAKKRKMPPIDCSRLSDGYVPIAAPCESCKVEQQDYADKAYVNEVVKRAISERAAK